MKRLAALTLAVAMLLPAPALAQTPRQQPDSDDESSPVSLTRIKRRLREAESSPPAGRLRLSYYVAVVGREEKPINLLKDFDAMNGPVPFAAPSHQELFDQVTPREFRPPAADVLGAAVWLGTKLAKKAVKK